MLSNSSYCILKFNEQKGAIMSHIFDPTQFKKLDSPKRKEAMPPALVCDLLSLNKDMVVADVGCGIGFFAFPFAKLAKHVLAIDISQIMTDELTNRIKDEGNIEVALGDFNTIVTNDSLDVFFTSTVIHEIDDLDAFTVDAIEKLKMGGRLAFLDFKKIQSDYGPPVDKRISADSVMALFKRNQLDVITQYDVKDDFYLVVGTKVI
jgi:ubiquinone/menaquinone biosynthesis C-methylase UbiE